MATAILFTHAPLADAAERWPGVRAGQGEAEARIFKALEEPTDVEFQDVPFKDVLQYLADFHKIPIIVDEKALTEGGVANDKAITTHLSKVSLRSALQLMLKNLDLDYVIRDEVLIVTTPEVATSSAPVCMFDVSSMTPTNSEMEQLMTVVQSNASAYQVQITVYRNVLLVKGNQRQQDEVAAFLATLFQMQTQSQQTPTTP